MESKWKYVLIATAVALAAVVCARSPIGDRILAKACILGQSKYGQCQLAK